MALSQFSFELYVTPFDHGGEPWDSPEGSEVSDLAAGQLIGFAIGVQDFDYGSTALGGGGGELDLAEWIPEAMKYSDYGVFFDIREFRADYFLDGMLLPANPVEPGKNSAVESVSWGRIKASLW